MAVVDFRRATLDDIGLIDAREQDRAELWASFHHTPEQALEYGLTHGSGCIGFIDEEPAGIFGVVAQGRAGAPWAVFTEVAERYPVAFLKACRLPVMAMKSNFDYLVNYVDARNTKAQQWLAWLGFTLYPSEPFGVDQLPFHKFDWHR